MGLRGPVPGKIATPSLYFFAVRLGMQFRNNHITAFKGIVGNLEGGTINGLKILSARLVKRVSVGDSGRNDK